jgi:hypothetical protein
MSTLSHYDTLEVSPKASVEVIRAAYKSLMQRHHPDKNADNAESTRQAASIAQAYGVLSDAQQRQAYDQTLLLHQAAQAHSAYRGQRDPATRAGQAAQPSAAARRHSWYAPALVLCIIVASGTILLLSPKKTPTKAPSHARASPAALPSTVSTQTGAASLHEPAQALTTLPVALQTRIIPAFLTDLSIDLAPVPGQPGMVHVLHIPNLSLRLSMAAPDRWVQRIQMDRALIIQRLLTTLADAQYGELTKSDGDLYLKRLIEDAVLVVVDLDRSSVLAAAGQPSRDAKGPVEALLPLSFTVR